MRKRCAAGSWHLVVVGLFLGGCASTGAPPRGYAYTVDSPSNACRANALYCAVAAGKDPAMATGTQAAQGAAVLAAALKLFQDEHQNRVEQVLKDCVEQANAEVNLRRFGANPTRAQCSEQVGVDTKGNPITRSMTLGTEKHQVAFRCIQERLPSAWPGGFSLEQRYRYDRQAQQTTLVSEEDAQALLRQGRSDELRGTLRPDIVIHAGEPLQALAVYDLKFPCPGTNQPKWNDYPQGHPYFRSNQGQIYREALKATPALVAPSWGII
jgi:hypothetical protein